MRDATAIRWVFLLQPLVLGAWFPRIPQVKAAIGLTEGELAFALIGMPIGLLAALSFGGKIAESLGSRWLLTLGLGSYLLLMPMPAFATSGWALFAALFVAGLSMAIAQLSLNVTASEVEARSPAPIMNGCHGFWSVGVLIGASIGALMAEIAIAPGTSLLLVSVLCFAPLILSARTITPFALRPDQDRHSGRTRPSLTLIKVALFGFGVAMTEGAMADWLAVFMTNTFAASPGVAGASYAVFALSVAIGRFLGDWLKQRFELVRLARGLVSCALLGLCIAVTSPVIWLSFVGVGVLGLGLSIGFPLAVSAAITLKGRSGAANVALLTQITLCGFLIGPPIIGLLAEVSNMRIGLAGLIPALLLSFAMTTAFGRR